jgi:hypothetical protein
MELKISDFVGKAMTIERSYRKRFGTETDTKFLWRTAESILGFDVHKPIQQA